MTLFQYRAEANGRIDLTPHRVTVGDSSRTITADRKRAYRASGGQWEELEIGRGGE